MKSLHLLLASVLVSGAAACGGGGPLDANDVAADQANAACSKLFECKSTYPGTEADFTAMFGATEADCRQQFLDGQNTAELQASIDAGRIEVNAQALNSCISWANNLTCDEVWNGTAQQPESCDMLYTPLVSDGDMCVIDEDCISGFCDPASMTCSAA